MSRCSASRRSAALAAFSMSASSARGDLELRRERSEAGHEARARFRRTPPDAVIEVAEAVGVFDGERGLADPAHALHGGPADLRHGGRLVAGENRVEPVERLSATGEARDARRHADKGPASAALRPLRRRMALGRGNDAASALLGIGDADEVLIDAVGEKPAQRHILAAQDDDVTVLRALQPLRLEARELLAGVGRLFVVAGEEDDEVARVLDRLVHRLDEARAERDVIILNEDLVALVGQNVLDLVRDGRDRSAPAEKEVERVPETARHNVFSLAPRKTNRSVDETLRADSDISAVYIAVASNPNPRSSYPRS